MFRYFEAEEGARYFNKKILVDLSFFCEAACFDAKRLLTPALKGQLLMKTRSSWLNYASHDGEAVYWVSIGHYEAVAVGN